MFTISEQKEASTFSSTYPVHKCGYPVHKCGYPVHKCGVRDSIKDKQTLLILTLIYDRNVITDNQLFMIKGTAGCGVPYKELFDGCMPNHQSSVPP